MFCMAQVFSGSVGLYFSIEMLSNMCIRLAVYICHYLMKTQRCVLKAPFLGQWIIPCPILNVFVIKWGNYVLWKIGFKIVGLESGEISTYLA